MPPAQALPGRAWRVWSIGLLGFSSGLPLALSSATLQAWFTTSGLSLKAIGWVTLIGQAYIFKFLWAPLLDRLPLPWLGRRRGWIVLMQLLCALALFCMSFYTPEGAATTIAFFGVLLAFASATQDIAYDAHRTDLLPPAERGCCRGSPRCPRDGTPPSAPTEQPFPAASGSGWRWPGHSLPIRRC